MEESILDPTAQELIAELIEQHFSSGCRPGEFTIKDYYQAQLKAKGEKCKGKETCRMFLRGLARNGVLSIRVFRHASYYRRVESE